METHEIFGDVIIQYTRKNALDDGVLVDISNSPATKEAGIKFPVAVTRSVFDILDPDEELVKMGQSFEGRLWDLWMIFRIELRKGHSQSDEIHFSPLFLLEADKKPEPVNIWAKCGPGDNGEPVITIMLEGED